MAKCNWLAPRKVSMLYFCWSKFNRWIDEQQPLSFADRSHSLDLTNIYLGLFNLFFLSQSFVFIFFFQPTCFHLQFNFLRIVVIPPCAIFISTVIIFPNECLSLFYDMVFNTAFLLSPECSLLISVLPTCTAMQHVSSANLLAHLPFYISLTCCVVQPYLIYHQRINSLITLPFCLLLQMWRSFRRSWFLLLITETLSEDFYKRPFQHLTNITIFIFHVVLIKNIGRE